MAKTKTPFFSLGAHGSVGQSITAQKRGNLSLVREKPLPADPRSLAQMYQRWLYEDYAYLWRQQSAAVQQQYRTAGVRFHLTGFQYWMKYQLTNLPDIGGWWKLDDNRGATTPDSSRNGNTATIFGASPADGLFNGALEFDGLNDYLDCGDDISLRPDAFSIELSLIMPVPGNDCLVTWGANVTPYPFFSTLLQLAFVGLNQRQWSTTTPVDINDGLAHHLVLTMPGGAPGDINNAILYIDGQVQNITFTNAGGVQTPKQDFRIGIRAFGGLPLEGILDDVRIYNRELDPTEAITHSLRRYPA